MVSVLPSPFPSSPPNRGNGSIVVGHLLGEHKEEEEEEERRRRTPLTRRRVRGRRGVACGQ